MKNILLIGLGRFGMHMAVKLNELGHEVMAVDDDEERVEQALPYVTGAQIGDSTNEDFLRSLGVANYDVCFVNIGDDFMSSLETTSLLKELGASKVVSRVSTGREEKFLLKNGADYVVYPEKQVANWTAIRFSSENILDYIALQNGYAIFEVQIPDSWAGKTIAELDVRRKYKFNVLAYRRDNGSLDLKIVPDEKLKKGQAILIIGESKRIAKMFNI